jgi:hypothetical protein
VLQCFFKKKIGKTWPRSMQQQASCSTNAISWHEMKLIKNLFALFVFRIVASSVHACSLVHMFTLHISWIASVRIFSTFPLSSRRLPASAGDPCTTTTTPCCAVTELETRDRGRSKSFNYKIIECSLFVWIFALWMDSSKDKI